MSAWDNDPYGVNHNSSHNGDYGQRSYQPDLNSRVGSWRSVIPMRPMSVGETLDAAVRLIRFNPVAFIVFPLIVNLVAGAVNVVLSLAFGQSTFTGMNDLGLQMPAAVSMLTAIITLAANLIVLVAGTRVTLATIRGEKLRLGDTFQLAKGQFGRLAARMFGLLLIMIAAIIVFTIIYASVILALFDVVDVRNTTVFYGAFLLPFVTLAIAFLAFYRFTVTAPAMVAEDIGPVRGISRSWHLTKGSLGYFIGLLLTVIVLAIALSIVVSLLLAFVAAFGVTSSSNAEFFLATSAIGTVLVTLFLTIIIAPFATAVTNLVYVNMRMKRESFHQDALFHAGRDQLPGSYGPSNESPYGQQFDPSGNQYGSESNAGGYGQWSSQPTPHNGWQSDIPSDSSYGTRDSQAQQRPQWYGDAPSESETDDDSPNPFSPR